jgi:hypothetical protein
MKFKSILTIFFLILSVPALASDLPEPMNITRNMHFSSNDPYFLQVKMPRNWIDQLKTIEATNSGTPIIFKIHGVNHYLIDMDHPGAPYPTGFSVCLIDQGIIGKGRKELLISKIVFQYGTPIQEYTVSLNPILHDINRNLENKSEFGGYLMFEFAGLNKEQEAQIFATGITLEFGKIN